MPLPPKAIQTSADLRTLQSWFSETISRPLVDGKINPNGTQRSTMEEESAYVVLPNVFLQPSERIEIYNQQYWYRLLTVMQEEYPCVRHLLGIEEFNGLIEEYLTLFPSSSFSLNQLGEQFVHFLESHYSFDDDPTILEAAIYETALSKSFEAKHKPSLNPNLLSKAEQEQLPNVLLKLQDSIFVYELHYHFEAYRLAVENDKDETIFPDLEEKHHFKVIFQHEHTVFQKDISSDEFYLLQAFKRGASITEALKNEHLSTEIADHIHEWFANWVRLGWFIA